MDLGQSHSNFALENLKQKELAIEFFSRFLPTNVLDTVRLETLQIEDGTLIDRKLAEHRTDILFTVRGKNETPVNLYLLFEHKSSPDSRLSFQLLRYISVLHERQTKPAPVIPIVFYHGTEKWNVSKDLHGALAWTENEKTALAEFVPNFEYALINTTDIDLEAIRASLQLTVFLAALKHIRDYSNREKYAILLGQASELFQQKDKLKFLEQLLTYIYRVHEYEPEDVRLLIEENVGKGLGDIAMTTAEKLEEKGIKKGKLEDARKMLEKKMNLQDILEITGLDRQTLIDEGLISE